MLTEAKQLFIDGTEDQGEILIFNGDDTEGRNLGHETMVMMQKRDPEYRSARPPKSPTIGWW